MWIVKRVDMRSCNEVLYERGLRTVPVALMRHRAGCSMARRMQRYRRRRSDRWLHAGLRWLSLVGSLALVLLNLCH